VIRIIVVDMCFYLSSSNLILVLRIEKKKGTLAFGADADFIFLDDQLNVLSTFIAGEQAWSIDERWSIEHLHFKCT
jgi:N-acetylglucosamine-6-phosphate deacetylase